MTTKSARPGSTGKRRKPSAGVVAAARGNRRDVNRIILGVVAVVVIAAGVIGGVFYQQYRTNQTAQTVIPALTVPGSASYPVSLDRADATVLVGKPTAKVTIDAYEDFLCPYCGEFESTDFPAIARQLSAGTVQVRYHLLDLLNNSSTPPGYSLMAANTALAVATVAPDKFIDFHYSLYQKQPKEDSPGWTQAQLTSLANRLGVSGSAFDALIAGKTYENQVQTNLTNAEHDAALAQPIASGEKGFATPTIVANGALVNWQTPGWLTSLTNAS